MKKLIGMLAVILILVAGIIGMLDYTYSDSYIYYTQVDNSKMEQMKTNEGVINLKGSLPYKYTLPCYNETGREKELTFTASKKLREDAFIQLTNRPIRGVVGWCEVRYDELPAQVQSKYEKSDG